MSADQFRGSSRAECRGFAEARLILAKLELRTAVRALQAAGMEAHAKEAELLATTVADFSRRVELWTPPREAGP